MSNQADSDHDFDMLVQTEEAAEREADGLYRGPDGHLYNYDFDMEEAYGE